MADKRDLEQQSTSTHIDTDGGAAVGGNVDVGGDFIGRDQRDHSDDVTGGKFHAQQQTIHIYNTPVGSTVAPTTPEPPPPPPSLPAVPNPYRGLEAFEAAHAANYFGRAAMVEKLLAKVQTTNFVAVVGPSGSGKSSLVRAGLVTALSEGKLPGSRDWQVAIIRPSDDPLRALATPLVNQIGPELKPVERLKQVREMADGLQEGSLPIGDVLAEVRTLHPGLSRLLLIFDQFEETFTLCSDDALRRTFLQSLLTAANTPWLTVLFTLRADFYGRVLEDEPLGRRVDAGLVNVLPMTGAERRAAIEQPALNAGRRFEEGLVQAILDDIETEPGELPLLQFALTELWERQTPDGVLTHAAYGAIGGVSGAIAKRADQTLKGLQSDEQAAVRRIFTRLVRVAQPDEGAEDTKRRITLAEVDPVMQALVYKLADARLLVTGRDEQSGSETVEVAHEALIRGWAELKVWLNSDREFLLWRQRLRSLVANWVASKEDEGALLRGALLTEAEPWLKTRTNDLSEQEQHFITASRALADREVQEREAARQRELDLERRRAEAERQRAETQLQATQQLCRRAVWLGVALFVAVVVAGVALYFYDVAEKTSLREVEARQIAEANTELAKQQLARLEGLRLYQEAEQLKAAGQVTEAIAAYSQADAADATLKINLTEQEKDVRRQAAILLVKAGEELARNGDLISAAEKYQAAFDLNPPPDTPVYVRVPAGEFTMGSTGTEQYSDDDEKPQHQVILDEFWILRTEVTNGQYKECVEAKEKGAANGCEPPSNSYWDKETLARWPVTHVTWQQASQYATWKGGRLPTEAEWEKACRSTDARIYPWGDELPTNKLANFSSNEGTVTDVGNYVDGQSPYGLLDMAGNVWEWTSSQFQEYPYEADDGREEPTGDAARTLRGGAFISDEDDVRCAGRNFNIVPSYRLDFVGFRVLSPGF
jgi:formylglycine-generating enzyme required for sulfatase activity/energy-coupling factor transporter ATP-binding protein EcfA2